VSGEKIFLIRTKEKPSMSKLSTSTKAHKSDLLPGEKKEASPFSNQSGVRELNAVAP
jgi:hypothetical protein